MGRKRKLIALNPGNKIFKVETNKYQTFFNAYRSLNPNNTGGSPLTDETIAEWNKIRENDELVDSEIARIKGLLEQKKPPAQRTLMGFLKPKGSEPSCSRSLESVPAEPADVENLENDESSSHNGSDASLDERNDNERATSAERSEGDDSVDWSQSQNSQDLGEYEYDGSDQDEGSVCSSQDSGAVIVLPPKKKAKATAQDSYKAIILQCDTRMNELENQPHLTAEEDNELRNLTEKKRIAHRKLRGAISHAESQKKYRDRQKIVVDTLLSQSSNDSQVSVRKGPGRIRLVDKYPGLVGIILKLVNDNVAASDRRRTEGLQMIRTLKDLYEEIQKLHPEYIFSRSGLYYQFIPRRSDTREGKRHLATVPIKIIKPPNNQRKGHQDSHYCFGAAKHLKDLIRLLGAKQCLVISQDDKSRVPIGIACANLQSPMVMSMQRKVRLPDHTFPVKHKYKLIPSVVGIVELTDEGLFSYHGPTFVFIRCALYENTHHATHACDVRNILNPNFEHYHKYGSNESGNKPVQIYFTDGGPDENPRAKNAISVGIRQFKDFNLDAYVVMTYAPGDSAYNIVERRMAPLSKALAGVLLDPEKFGGLKDKDMPKDEKDKREMANLMDANYTLAQIWNNLTIDEKQVLAFSIKPIEEGQNNPYKYFYEEGIATREWISKHVRQTRYTLQIVKCLDETCCSPFRSKWNEILKDRFLPAPTPYVYTDDGYKIWNSKDADVKDKEYHYLSLENRIALASMDPVSDEMNPLPYDYFCPSLIPRISSYICTACGICTVRVADLDDHKKSHAVGENYNTPICAKLSEHMKKYPKKVIPPENSNTNRPDEPQEVPDEIINEDLDVFLVHPEEREGELHQLDCSHWVEDINDNAE